MGDGQEWCAIHQTRNRGVPVYFIESNKYFDRWGIYHDADFNDYRDNARRFGFFSRRRCSCAGIWLLAGCDPCARLADGPGGGLPEDLALERSRAGAAASLLTIHNIAYQGVYSAGDYGYWAAVE